MMKRITFRGPEELIDAARRVAEERNTTLNAAFREWLEDYAATEQRVRAYDALMKRLSHVRAGRKFTRDEMNER